MQTRSLADPGSRIPEMQSNGNPDSVLKAAVARLSLSHTGIPEDGGDLNPAQLTKQIKQLDLIHAETGKLLQEAVLAARAAELSWTEIGKILGVSKQAVQRRFGNASALQIDVASERIIGPVNRGNEVSILNEAGMDCWKLFSSRHGEHLA